MAQAQRLHSGNVDLRIRSMPLRPEEQDRFDQLARVIADELKVRVLGMRRSIATVDEVGKVAALVADEVLASLTFDHGARPLRLRLWHGGCSLHH